MSVDLQAPATAVAAPRRFRGAVATVVSLQRDHPIAQVAALVALFCFGAFTIESFTSGFSIRSMLVLSSLLGISAIGQTVCLLVGGLDISIPGWILAGSTVTVELLGGQGERWSVAEVFVVLGIGSILIGGLTGWICYRYHTQSLVVTLGTGAIVTGAILAWKRNNITGVAPSWLTDLSSAAGRAFGIGVPGIVFVWVAITIVMYLLLQRSIVGAWLYATGNNRRAAELALVPTAWVWAGAFALSAFSATLAGVLLSGFTAGGDATVGTPYLWNGLTAVLVGGTAFGARGDYFRTVIGSLLVVVLAQVMFGHGLGFADQNILYGALILVVVGIYSRDRRLRDQV